MRRFVIVVLCLLAAVGARAQTADLLISEYVEGSAYNKAIELFNGTEQPVDLSLYSLDRYANGETTGVSIDLGPGTLAAGEVYVIANPSADAAVLAAADLTSSDLNFNGNDALVLTRLGMVVDSFGQVGYDPGSAWICVAGSTVNHTLRRNPGVCSGDLDPFDAFNPCLQYTFEPSDAFDGLGAHVADCLSVPVPPVSWDALKALYR